MSTKPNDGPAVVQRPRRGLIGVLHVLAASPAAALSLLPIGTCPLCIAGNLGVLSGISIPLVGNGRVRSVVVVIFLLTTIFCVGFVARKRGSIAPLAVVLAGSLSIVAARLIWNIPSLAYLGATTLAAGATWSTVRRARVKPPDEPVKKNESR